MSHPACRSRQLVSTALLFSILIASCSAGQAPTASATLPKAVCPTCQAFITATPLPTSTDTPAPPATDTPTPTPPPTLASFIRVHKCVGFTPQPAWGAPVHRSQPYAMWCVLNIKAATSGMMMVDFYWSATSSNPDDYVTVPPATMGTAIYILDNLGNKYNFTQKGGCVDKNMTTHSGGGCSGWLIFPAFKPGATSASFYEPRQEIAITDISLIGENPAATSIPLSTPTN